jgi:hypothetical protein
MKITHEFHHDINLVFKTLTDPVFLKQRALELGSIDASCDCQGAQPDLQIRLVRQREIKIPAVLSAFLKKVQTASTNEHWTHEGEQYNCENSTEIDGAPLSIKGNVNLAPSSSGCTYTANFETTAKIIFGKKKLQQYAGKTIKKELELECEYTQTALESM